MPNSCDIYIYIYIYIYIIYIYIYKRYLMPNSVYTCILNIYNLFVGNI